VAAISIKKSVFACCPDALKGVLARIEASEIGYRLAKGMFWSLMGTVLSKGLGIISAIVVARTLGKAGYGALGIIDGTLGLFEIFACFGLSTTATKYVAEYRSSDPRKVGRIVGLSWAVAAVTGGLSAGALLILAPWLSSHALAAPHLAGLLRITAIGLFISAMNAAQTGFLSGCEAFRTIAGRNVIAGLLNFPMMVVGVLWAGLEGAVWAIVASSAARWFICHLAVRSEARRFNIPLTFSACTQELPLLWRFSLPAVLSGMMVTPVHWICSAMLVNQPDGYAQMGLLNVGNQWRTLVMLLANIVMGPVLPILSSALSEPGDAKSFKKALSATQSLIVMIAFPACTGLMFFADSLLRLYWKPTAHESAVLIVLLSVALIQCLGAVAGSAIQAKGKMWLGFAFNLSWAIVYVALVAVLVRRQGAMALALGQGIAYVVLTLWGFAYIRADLPEGMLRRVFLGLTLVCLITAVCVTTPSSWRLWLAIPGAVGAGAAVMRYLVGHEMRLTFDALDIFRRRGVS
jgi:O-antigen/teichoic acid export membrane protein